MRRRLTLKWKKVFLGGMCPSVTRKSSIFVNGDQLRIARL
jgi:hypothetical protein